jgi:sodium-coupled neutral amino acid transporter 11
MFSFAFGAMLAYLIIIGDTVPVVLGEWTGSAFFGNRTNIIVVCATCICLPLSSLRDIGKLAHTSALSIAAVVLIIVIVLARAQLTSEQQGVGSIVQENAPGQPLQFAHRKYFQAFGAMSFAFVCQHSSFLVRNSLREPRVRLAPFTCFSLVWWSVILCSYASAMDPRHSHVSRRCAFVLTRTLALWLHGFHAVHSR